MTCLSSQFGDTRVKGQRSIDMAWWTLCQLLSVNCWPLHHLCNGNGWVINITSIIASWSGSLQYIPQIMHIVCTLSCFPVSVMSDFTHILHDYFPDTKTIISSVSGQQSCEILVNKSSESIRKYKTMITKQSTTKLGAYFINFTILEHTSRFPCILHDVILAICWAPSQHSYISSHNYPPVITHACDNPSSLPLSLH